MSPSLSGSRPGPRTALPSPGSCAVAALAGSGLAARQARRGRPDRGRYPAASPGRGDRRSRDHPGRGHGRPAGTALPPAPGTRPRSLSFSSWGG